MSEYYEMTASLTHHAVLKMLGAAVAKAEEIGAPQCVCIVDASGVSLGQIRMKGAKFLSLKSAMTKAQTAASIRAASSNIPEAVRPHIAAATQNAVTGLTGGLPIMIDGHCAGGIGIGSGSPEQDLEVAQAALAAIGI